VSRQGCSGWAECGERIAGMQWADVMQVMGRQGCSCGCVGRGAVGEWARVQWCVGAGVHWLCGQR
jgi:hypothetical protein